MSNNIQNEIIDLIYSEVIQYHINVIKYNGPFSLSADEAITADNKTILSIVLRTVNENLSIEEYLIGIYRIDNLKSETIHLKIKVIFFLNLLL